ncbi:hypothetical protein DVH05_006266 [Phytophthora capsici]|nr:hypothetical protein DVH05_006266 [Phytophthora capsici]
MKRTLGDFAAVSEAMIEQHSLTSVRKGLSERTLDSSMRRTLDGFTAASEDWVLTTVM